MLVRTIWPFHLIVCPVLIAGDGLPHESASQSFGWIAGQVSRRLLPERQINDLRLTLAPMIPRSGTDPAERARKSHAGVLVWFGRGLQKLGVCLYLVSPGKDASRGKSLYSILLMSIDVLGVSIRRILTDVIAETSNRIEFTYHSLISGFIPKQKDILT